MFPEVEIPPCKSRPAAVMAGILAVLTAASGSVGAQEALYVEGKTTSALCRDLDGDGLKEILVAYHRDGQRFLGIFGGRKRYGRAPDRSVPIDSRAIWYMVGDVSPEPGLELLLVSRTSGVLYPFAGNGSPSSIRRLFSTNGFFTMASRQELPPWLSARKLDLDGDGRDDICLVEKDHLRLLFQAGSPSPSGSIWGKEVRLPVRYYLLTGTREEKIRRAVEDFLEKTGRARPLLDLTGAYPFPLLADFDGNGLTDVIVKQPGQRLEVFLQHAPRSFPDAPDVAVPVPWAKKAAGIRLVDLNGDRRLDLVATVILLESLATEIRIFLQDPKRKDAGFARPLQSLRVKGFFRGPELADVQGDGKLDLLVSTYRLDLLNSAGKKAVEEIELTHEVFPGREDGPFARRPAFQQTFVLRTQALEEGGRRPYLYAGDDLTGDGRPDILFLDNGHRLRLYRGGEEPAIGFEEVTSFEGKVEDPAAVDIVDLDGGGGKEVVLRYERRLEIRRAEP